MQAAWEAACSAMNAQTKQKMHELEVRHKALMRTHDDVKKRLEGALSARRGVEAELDKSREANQALVTQRIDMDAKLVELQGEKNDLRRALDSATEAGKSVEETQLLFEMQFACTGMLRDRLRKLKEDARGGEEKPLHERSGCTVCLSNTAEWACVPCGHLVICSECKDGPQWAAIAGKCPVCREHFFEGDHGMLRIHASGVDVFE